MSVLAATYPLRIARDRWHRVASRVPSLKEQWLAWWLQSRPYTFVLAWEVQRALRSAPALAARLHTRGTSEVPAEEGSRSLLPPRQDPPLFFKESPMAHRWLDGLCGLEIGASAHNPFGLQAKNVGLSEEMDPTDFLFFKEVQIAMCGTWAAIDVPGTAEAIPVADDSQDFVLSSHVWEHLPNPLVALEEWVRVVRSGGYIFAIVPKRNALDTDVGRPVTPLALQIAHHLRGSTHEQRSREEHQVMRGHYTVFNLQSLLAIEAWYNRTHPAQLERIAFQITDDKVGNGHAILWRVRKG